MKRYCLLFALIASNVNADFDTGKFLKERLSLEEKIIEHPLILETNKKHDEISFSDIKYIKDNINVISLALYMSACRPWDLHFTNLMLNFLALSFVQTDYFNYFNVSIITARELIELIKGYRKISKINKRMISEIHNKEDIKEEIALLFSDIESLKKYKEFRLPWKMQLFRGKALETIKEINKRINSLLETYSEAD